MNTSSPVYALADALRRAGVSTVPIRADGSKAPTTAWVDYRHRLPTADELRAQHGNGCGVAVIGGQISGNLEVIDFDAPALVAPWKEMVEGQAPGLLRRLVATETPSGGRHIFYRHRGEPEGNRKLAQELRPDDEGRDRPYTLIETRGEGGYAIVPPSPAACHPSGRAYRLLHGDLTHLPVIDAEERAILLAAARALTRYIQPPTPAPVAAPVPTQSGAGTRPGDAFNTESDWPALLEPAGWRRVYARHDVTAWRRPGKERGISATTGYGGTHLLYVFSSNAAPFQPDTTYSPFEAYALLHHRGDRRAAARSLADKGYGTPRPVNVVDIAPAQQTRDTAVAAWPDPTPLGLGPLPEFPMDRLPTWLRAYAEALATALQVPPALTGMLALAITAATVANTAQVLVKSGYVEPINIWVVVPLGPGNRKSATVRALTRPLAEWQRATAEGMRAEIAEAESRAKIAKGALERAEAQAAKASTDAERRKATGEATTLAREAGSIAVPHAPRILAGDTTAERLVSLMAAHGERMAIISPEGTIFSLMAGRYSNGVPNVDVYLNGHAGDTIYVERVGRPPDFVDRPALTLGIAPQPRRLARLGETEEFRESGLLARFLYALPETLVGVRDRHAPPVPAATASAYDAALKALLALTPGEDMHGRAAPHTLRLSPEAFDAWDTWGETIEPQLHPTRGELADIVDWASKLEGAVARLAGVLHMALHAGGDDPWTQPITGETMRAARTIGGYLIPHAHAAFALMGGAPSTNEAEIVLEWIEERQGHAFNESELWQSVRRHFADQRDRLAQPLSILVEHGYIRPREMERATRGQQPAQIYDVNPKKRTSCTSIPG